MAFDPSQHLEKTHCPICGPAARSQELFPAKLDIDNPAYAFSARRERKIQHYRTVRCLSCGLVRADPAFDHATCLDLYTRSSYLYETETDFAAATYFRLFAQAFPDLPRNAAIVEVGGGDGRFLHFLSQNGFTNFQGFELSGDSVENAPPVVKANIRLEPFTGNSRLPESLDVIVNFHLLDHLAAPLDYLADCHSALRPGGSLLLACHDEQSLPAKILGEKCPIYDVEHIFLFNRKTLRLLLEKAGFEVAGVTPYWNTYPIEYWMRMITFLQDLRRLLPKAVARRTVSLPAGNIFALARKY